MRKDPRGYFTDISCNCKATRPGGTIVCDAALLDYFRNLLTEINSEGFRHNIEDVIRRANGDVLDDQTVVTRAVEAAEYVTLALSQSLLRWVLGHEVGHIVLGHLETFGPGLVARKRSLEEAADRFVIERMPGGWKTPDAHLTSLALTDTVQKLYGQALEQNRPGTSPSLPHAYWLWPRITLADKDDHPPLILRALSMLEQYVDQPGYDYLREVVDSVRQRITLQPTGATVNLCDSRPTLTSTDAKALPLGPPEWSDLLSAPPEIIQFTLSGTLDKARRYRPTGSTQWQ